MDHLGCRGERSTASRAPSSATAAVVAQALEGSVERLGDLARHARTVAATTPVLDVDVLFRCDETLRSVVAQTSSGLRLVDRTWFALQMAGRLGYGRGLHARRRIDDLDLPDSLVLDSSTPVSAAVTAVLARSGSGRHHDDIIVTGAGGTIGVVAVAAVLESLSSHFAHQSLHDPLTGLPNRLQLMQRLHGLQEQRRDAVLLHVDLDGFKEVNDLHGHHAGDQVLVQFGRRLRDLAREDDLVIRLGGDEFAVLVCRGMTPAQSSALAHRVVRRAADPFVVVEADSAGVLQWEVLLGASVGITHSGDVDGATEAASLDLLLRQADLAMYRAKSRGRGRAERFEAALTPAPAAVESTRRQRSMERRLRTAIRDGALQLHYQPIVELLSGRVTGVEALARWRDVELGSVPPDQFIPLAERTGLILDLGRWIMRTACTDAAGWSTAEAAVSVSVNVSAVQLADPAFVADVSSALANAGLPPQRLCLEVTETAAIADLQEACARLEHLRSLGVRLALDDFGTGHSSLTMLQRLPVNTVKIDRSFIDRMTSDPADAVLVRLVIDAAHSLGHRVCAEGVEREDQAHRLLSMGADLAQGWLFGRPLPTSAQLADALQRRHEVDGDRSARGAGASPAARLR